MTVRLFVLLLAAVVLSGCDRAEPTAAPPSPSPLAPSSPPSEPDPAPVSAADLAGAVTSLELAPVSTFEQACSRCHGPQGSFYGEAFGELEGAELHEMVREMMVGPAFLSPSEAEVDAMVAYHRALAAGEPFLCVFRVEHADGGSITVSGECSPDAALALTAPAARDLAVDAEGRWQTMLDGPGVLVLDAIREDKASSLRCPPNQWTHAAAD